MMKRHWFTIAVLAALSGGWFLYPPPRQKVLSPAASMIEGFYRMYLDARSAPVAITSLPFSRTLQDLMDRNEAICQTRTGTDVCGWTAGGDVYLDTQEIGPSLSFETSHFAIVEPETGNVEVRFNVYPELPQKAAHYNRSIRFQMLKENGRWVVDDLVFLRKQGNESLREKIQKEIKSSQNK